MKNLLFSLSLFAAVMVSGCTKSEKNTENQETTSTETTTSESSSTTQRPAHGEPGHNHETDHQVAAVYSCPMHPEITSEAPGNCPKCGMALEKMALPNEAAH